MLVFRVRTFGVLVAGMLVIAGFMLSVFRMFVNDMFGIAQSGSVFGAFVGGVGFEFGSIRGTMLFDFFGFFFGEFGFRGGLIFGSVEVRLFLAILFFGLFVFGKFCFADEVNPFGLSEVSSCLASASSNARDAACCSFNSTSLRVAAESEADVAGSSSGEASCRGGFAP
jgi:hypothetical protein